MTNSSRILENNEKISQLIELIRKKTNPIEKKGDYIVRVIDYDGSIIKEERLNTGDEFVLPNSPEHDNLIFEEWVSPVNIVDNKIIVGDEPICIGPIYKTISGLSEFDIELMAESQLAVPFYMNGTKYWGDGTSDDLYEHTYAAPGKYTIKCDGTSFSSSMNNGIFNGVSRCVEARFANIYELPYRAFYTISSLKRVSLSKSFGYFNNNCFYQCYALGCVIVPNGVTGVSNGFIESCTSLKNIVIPKTITKMSNAPFRNCTLIEFYNIPQSVNCTGTYFVSGNNALKSFKIPTSETTSLPNYFFDNCSSLESLKIPKNITSINNCFNSCRSLSFIDMSEFDEPPTVHISAFNNVYPQMKILVKDEVTLEKFRTATNWAPQAFRMRVKE